MKRATCILHVTKYPRFISIHALVKRATESDMRDGGRADISIHALVKRATLFSGWISSKKIISIHALVKRATQTRGLAF